MTPEKKIEEYLRQRVVAIGGKAYKLESPGSVGMPDRLVCIPGLAPIFAEVKAPGKTVRPNQAVRIRELIRLGQSVWVVDSKELVDEFIADCEKILSRGLPVMWLTRGGKLPEEVA